MASEWDDYDNWRIEMNARSALKIDRFKSESDDADVQACIRMNAKSVTYDSSRPVPATSDPAKENPERMSK